MATAYVLINCELGSEEAVISELKTIDGVVDVHGTFGAYDILTKVGMEHVFQVTETLFSDKQLVEFVKEKGNIINSFNFTFNFVII